ncbi:hypothetical protein PINS_up004859 [Pythium insidiosum]|nr:hypothetical protein PINS_up004859 [Pythium insidiosum]
MAILCCVCGAQIEPNAMNMCTSCIAAEVDIAEGIDLQNELHQCSACLRYLSRGKNQLSSMQGAWLECPWESTELMALCLKHVHGLSKAKLVDANFIWTEPHSKRVKVKLTLQREVLHHALVQNSCVVTFVVRNQQCPDCAKQYRNHTWRALVQIRQKADHKRTFFRLEQLILKHKAHTQAIGITTVKDGLDFYFATKNAGERFVHFLAARVPMRSKASHKLVSENVRQNTGERADRLQRRAQPDLQGRPRAAAAEGRAKLQQHLAPRALRAHHGAHAPRGPAHGPQGRAHGRPLLEAAVPAARREPHDGRVCRARRRARARPRWSTPRAGRDRWAHGRAHGARRY